MTDTNSFPLLLNSHTKMHTKTLHYTPLSAGHTPLNRPITQYLNYGIINLDKPTNPSSHEVVTWVKNMLNVDKTGHCGTLDPKVSGALTILLNRSTRLAKSQQSKGKQYICKIKFHNNTERNVLEKNLLVGALLQRPPLMCAVKRNLRLRQIYAVKIEDFNSTEALLRIDCEAGTYIRTYCVHLGLLMGCGAHMEDLRRTRSGTVVESVCHTMHDLLDATTMLDETVLRRVVLPLETLLLEYKRIIVKDSAVSAVCYGGQLTVKGVLRYDGDIEIGTEIVLVTTKGEAVALANAVVASPEMACMEHGIVCRTKRVIMEKDLYPRAWKLGAENDVVVVE